MFKKVFFSIALLTVFSANARTASIIEVQEITESFVNNYCQFTGPDLSLENFSIKSISEKNITGYDDSIKEVKVKLELIFGNDDYLYEEEELLILDNKTGNFRITSAIGPCSTIIQHN